MKKILFILLFISTITITFAINNYFRTGENWDANVSSSETANDIWTFSGRLDLEDSRTNNYINNGYRGKLTGWLESNLFGSFKTNSELLLKFKGKYTDSIYTDEIKNKCLDGNNWTSGPEPEIYSISGSIVSSGSLYGTTGENLWGIFYTSGSLSDSYFCSNKKIFLHLFSEIIGNKKVGSGIIEGDDIFSKQEIYIQGIANINGNTKEGILARGNQDINKISVYIGNKTKIKGNINKNIATIYKTYLNSSGNKANLDTINNFSNDYKQEYYYIYDYNGETENINFNGNTYINKGKKLIIENNSSNKIVNVKGINTVIVQGGNIYIKSDIKNGNDKKDLLTLVAKRDKNSGNGGNIYISPEVTNIDAILISDGSLISLLGNEIQYIQNSTQLNNLRKQLLIYGKILSANNVGTDKIPFGADLYENPSYLNNEIPGNIYDLGNLRTFNLNYGGGEGVISGCNNENKLTPIQTDKNSWAGRKECYNDDPTQNNLRGSDKLNPLIILNNNNIDFISPFILRN